MGSDFRTSPSCLSFVYVAVGTIQNLGVAA